MGARPRPLRVLGSFTLGLLCIACQDPELRGPVSTAKAPSQAPELQQGETASLAPESSSPTPPGPPSGRVPADELYRLEGQPETALLKEFGPPDDKRAFTMAECCHEFEIELLNTYPPKGGHEDVPIQEWTWDYEGYKLTVWLHRPAGEGEWIVLETSRYGDEVSF